jgi:hypothetical protein
MLRPIGVARSTRRSNSEQELARYPIGATVRVFYKAGDPGYAVLDTESDVGAVVGLVFVGLGSIGAGIWMFVALQSFIQKGVGSIR